MKKKTGGKKKGREIIKTKGREMREMVPLGALVQLSSLQVETFRNAPKAPPERVHLRMGRESLYKLSRFTNEIRFTNCGA